MANFPSMNTPEFKPKSFWQKPEGFTGGLFLVGIGAVVVYFWGIIVPFLRKAVTDTFYMVAFGAALVALLYVILDPRMRNLIWFAYKSIMRWITGVFVEIDPIGILKSYIDSLRSNLSKLSQQIAVLQGQMVQMAKLMNDNNREIEQNMRLAEQAKKQGQDSQIVLFTRKAARMQESNEKYDVLYKRMEVLKRILTKMEENSKIVIEDMTDQVKMKEQERKAIRTSHSAMRSAMSVLSGDPDKRAMFEMAMESINNDVANKVGEMERFMEMSSSIMDSIDLQNGVFEESGMKMLEEWEQKSSLLLLDGKKIEPVQLPNNNTEGGNNEYNNMFR